MCAGFWRELLRRREHSLVPDFYEIVIFNITSGSGKVGHRLDCGDSG